MISLKESPTSFNDFFKIKEVKFDKQYIEWSEEQLSFLKNYLTEYIKYGGLPEVALTPSIKELRLHKNILRQSLIRT